MPVTPSYPGIYIEELPSTVHTIAAAPTSIAVFVGYTHPWQTRTFNQAVEIFSFADYQREFGGFYTGTALDNSVALAVYQFFLNGGSDAYVVGLQATHYKTAAGTNAGTVARATAQSGGVVFTAKEPVDPIPMEVKIANASTDGMTADVTVTYGSRPPEVYRGVSLHETTGSPAMPNADFIATRLGQSAFVTVGLSSSSPVAFTNGSISLAYATAIPASAAGNFDATDFAPLFDADSTLDKVPIFNLLALPGVTDLQTLSAAVAFAEHKRAFAILDPRRDNVASPTDAGPDIADLVVPKHQNAALYFPYVKSTDPLTGKEIAVAPSGYVAGIYARTDNNRGVWKAPAGLETTLLNTSGVVDKGRMTDMRQGKLNLAGINCLRTLPGVGTIVNGARTLSTQEQWRYVPVRRMALFIEQTLYRNLGWAVFEPNDEPLWVALRTSVENFMLSLFARGAFQGSKPSQAFLVQCDHTTTTQTDVNNGIVNILVGFAPLKPAEFVIVKIAQLAGQSQ